jgi:hypothetical protein
MDIRNASNQLIAVVRQNGAVYDTGGRCLGYTNPRGTFDVTGRQLSSQNVPGLLIKQ